MLKRFFSYVEIKTKITSIFAFLMTIAYLLYLNQPIRTLPTISFFISMFVFDLTTTAINNYIDTKTNHQTLQFKRSVALILIYLLLFISIISALFLVYLTDIVVLILGGLCFACGIFYTYGPVPISRLPLGELFSGIFYGFLIPFILLYINMPENTYLSLAISSASINITINIFPIATVLLLSVAPICTTANIMFANNYCDLEKDILVKRYTLPYFLGKKSLYLFAFLYYLIYFSVFLMVALKILHIFCLSLLLTIIPVQININKFIKKQEKETTFLLSIKNYIIIMSSITIAIFISSFF